MHQDLGHILFLSGHDYRSRRKANIHFLAEAARQRFSRVSFFSIGYSSLSRFRGDPRAALESQAGRWEPFDGVCCYLWKTPFHPFNPGERLGRALTGALYDLYKHWPANDLDAALASASVIVFESGLSPLFIERARRENRTARFIYIASDLLSTIKVHDRVVKSLDRGLDEFEVIRVAARAMIPAFDRASRRVRFIPHGIDKSIAEKPMRSPYAAGAPNLVSVGSMLFDPQFFFLAASAFPEATFHVIGSKQSHNYPPNVVQYPETPFAETLPYIRFADVGLAPYRAHPEAEYLADSSMKLTQYGFLGLPAVCPHFAVGEKPNRFGYTPGDLDSIKCAITSALACQATRSSEGLLSWPEVLDEILLEASVQPYRLKTSSI